MAPMRAPIEIILALIAWLAAMFGTGEAVGQTVADGDRAYRAATGFLQRGLHAEAIAEYRTAIRALGDEPLARDAWYGLAVAARQTEDWPMLREAAGHAAADESFKYAIDARLLLAEAHLALDSPNDALTALIPLKTLGRDDPRAAPAAHLQLEAARRSGDTATYLAATRRFIEQLPKQEDAAAVAYAGARAALSAGESADALRFANFVVETAADENLRGFGLLARAAASAQAGDAAAAEKDWTAAAKASSAAVAVPALTELFNRRLQAGDSSAVVALAEQIVAAAPANDTADAVRLRGAEAALALRDFGRARALLGTLTDAKGPIGCAAQHVAARALLQQEDFPSAAAAFAGMIAACTKADCPATVRLDWAYALLRAGRAPEALDVLQETDAASLTTAQQQSVAELRVRCATDAGRFADALTALRQLAALERTDNTLADLALYVADAARAADDANAASSALALIEHAPNLSNLQRCAAWLRSGLARLENGDAEGVDVLQNVLDGDCPTAERRIAAERLAQHATQRADWPRAAELWKGAAAISESPATAAAATLAAGQAYRSAGEPAQAVELLDQIPPELLAPEQQRARLLELAQGLLELGRQSAAMPHLQTLAQPGQPREIRSWAAQQLVAAARTAGDVRAADAALALAVETAADDGERDRWRLQRASFLQATGAEQARAVLDELETQVVDPAAKAELRARRAIDAVRRGDADTALAIFEQLRGADWSSLPASLRTAGQLAFADVLRKQARAADAERLYLALTEDAATPNAARAARLALGEIAFARADWTRVRDVLGPLLDDAPPDATSITARYLSGAAAHRTGAWSDAISQLERFESAADDASTRASARLLLADAQIQAGRPEDALAVLGRLLGETTDAAIRSAALLRRGAAAAELQRWAESDAAYAAFLAEFGDDARTGEAEFGRGWAAENQKRFAEARTFYGRLAADSADPRAPRAQFQIGETFYAEIELERAAAELLKVDILYAAGEWTPAALYEAGRCYLGLGRDAEARAQFEAVAQRFPETEWAALARTKLGERRAHLPGHADGAARPAQAPRSK